MDYICKEGDRLDLICYRVYGHHNNGVIGKVRLMNLSKLTDLYVKFIEDAKKQGNDKAFYKSELPRGFKLTLPDELDINPKKKVRRLF